jgi:hypothetical protein
MSISLAGRISIAGVELPDRIGPWTGGRVTDYEASESGLGKSIAYHGGSLGEATLYIYDHGLARIPDGAMNPVVRAEFDECTRAVLAPAAAHGREIELTSCYATGAPDKVAEFLCAEFLDKKSDGDRTFLYLTGANDQFVKIRLSLRLSDETNPAAQNFVDQVAAYIWQTREVRLAEGEHTWDLGRGDVRNAALAGSRFHVLGVMSIELPRPWFWQVDDIEDPTARGVTFITAAGSDSAVAQILVADVTADAEEVHVDGLTIEKSAEFDLFLHQALATALPREGRRITRWMSSQLNEQQGLKALVTAFMEEEAGIERQTLQARMSWASRKFVLGCRWDVDRSDQLASPLISALKGAYFLNPRWNN